MKNLILLIFLFPLLAFSNPKLKDLIEVNSNWKQQTDGIEYLNKSSELKSDNDILYHLMLVEKTLRQRPVNGLNETQKHNRIKYLNILNSYWKAGKVPLNTYHLKRTPVFIDENRTHCAVGYLLQQGGYASIAESINRDQKFAYIQEITNPDLKIWQVQSGLSVEELAWIQPSYPFEGTSISFGQGLNGIVNDIKKTTGKYQYIAAGSFKIESNNQNILMAGWDGNKWNAIVAGTGVINKLKVANYIITSYGSNITFGNFNQIEIFETNIETSVPKHTLKGEFNGAVTGFETYKGLEYVCGLFNEGLAVFVNSAWKIIPVDGIDTIHCIKTFKNNLIIGGKETFQLTTPNPALISYDGTNFQKIDGLSFQPKCFGIYQGLLMIGVTLGSGGKTSELLYEFDGFNVEKSGFIKYTSGSEVRSIITNKNKLLIVGAIRQSVPWQGSSYGLSMYDSDQPQKSNFIITLDGPVNTAIMTGNDSIIIAGEFKYNVKSGGRSEILFGCGIVFESGYKEISDISDKPILNTGFKIYPNPTKGLINFSEQGILYDLSSRKVMDIFEGDYNLENLPNGIYIFSNKRYNMRIIKE